MSASAALNDLTPMPVCVVPERPDDAQAVEALVLAAFGPGRFAKTAERLREAASLAAGFVVHDGERLIGSVRLWSIVVGQTPVLFLGPIAVDTASRRGGLGADLVGACVDHARESGVPGVLLVGDAPYFERFGFVAAPEITLPGPFDRRRVMWLPITSDVPVGRARAG